MFPRDFFVDYWSPTIRDQLFVAMPFAPQFDEYWERAVRPAAEEAGLPAYRVDARLTSDSILVDILDGIAHSRLVLVDVSPVSCAPSSSVMELLSGRARRPRYPNGNVMYELGLAHAARQAEEVILVRNDAEHPLLFDMSGVRVHRYPADDYAEAKVILASLIVDALRTVERTKSLQVEKAVQSISISDLRLVRKFWPHGFTLSAADPDADLNKIPTELNEAAAHLQRAGILRVKSVLEGQACAVSLEWTEFGNAVVQSLGSAVFAGRIDPMTAALNAALAKQQESVPVLDSPAATDGPAVEQAHQPDAQ